MVTTGREAEKPVATRQAENVVTQGDCQFFREIVTFLTKVEDLNFEVKIIY